MLERPSIPFNMNETISDHEHQEYLAMLNSDKGPLNMRGFHQMEAELKLQSAPASTGLFGSLINMLSFGCVTCSNAVPSK